jgi:hypothetical protein
MPPTKYEMEWQGCILMTRGDAFVLAISEREGQQVCHLSVADGCRLMILKQL